MSEPSRSEPGLERAEAGAMSERAPPPAKRARVAGVDVARGLASLIMIQGHAYDGWASAEAKQTGAYAFTRLLGSLPLPAFLALAGAAIMLRTEAAIERGHNAAVVRRGVAKRGFVVLLWGYGTNAAYALMDGGWDRAETLLRADVLHVIGLSIIALAAMGIRPRGMRSTGPPDRRLMERAALALLVVPTALCPWLSPLGADLPLPFSAIAGLFVDAPGITRMPVVPLISWVALGALTVSVMRRFAGERPGLAGAPPRFFVALGAGSLAVAVAAHYGTGALLASLGGSLSRAHPAVWLNVIDLGARALLVLALAGLATPHLPTRPRAALVRLGQGSLLAYVFHIPFSYGRLGSALSGRLSMGAATLAVLALMAASYGVVLARDLIRARSRAA